MDPKGNYTTFRLLEEVEEKEKNGAFITRKWLQ
jgi:hypothetical protein